MSKKSSLIIGIILLAVGGGLIPTGYFINTIFVDQVYDGVPEALLGIQEEALPSLESQIPGLKILLGIEETGYTIPELAQFAFYEQWANGTIFGVSILTEGFLTQRDTPIYGPPFFEVGLQIAPTGISVPQCATLWNENSEYSLVSAQGINKWYKAKSGNTLYDELKLNNGDLTNTQMDAILTWLPKFRDVLVNKLAKEELNLSMEPYDLGNTIFIGLGAGGGVLAALGVVILVLSRRKTKI